MAVRSTNTMDEGLTSIVQMLAQMKMAPDVDLPFVLSLEQQVLAYNQKKYAPSLPPDAGQPGMGGMMAGAPGGGGADMAAMLASLPGRGPVGPPPGGMPGPMPGGPAMVSPTVPNPDELRRIQTVGPATTGR